MAIRLRSARTRQMPGACPTCTETSGNGPATESHCASSAAAVGTSERTAPRVVSATRIARRIAASASASAWPGIEEEMAVSDSFRVFVLEQLEQTTRDIRAKRMFGGVGIYAGEDFFALIDN